MEVGGAELGPSGRARCGLISGSARSRARFGRFCAESLIMAAETASRSFLTSKIHLIANRRCRLVSRVPTAGHGHDSPAFEPVIDGIRIGTSRQDESKGSHAQLREYSDRFV
jgi:hypothetical protein